MSYNHATARCLFRELFAASGKNTNLHYQHMSYGESFPLQKYWGALMRTDDQVEHIRHQEEMVLLLNEVVGVSDDD